MDGDSDDQGYQLLTDDKTTEVDEEESSEESHNIPSCEEVKDKCLIWYERQDESTSTSLLLLKRTRDLAATKCLSNLKQMNLNSFF